MEEYLKNNKGLQVLTDSGWSNFDGLQSKGKFQTVTVKTDKTYIICTPTHEFYDIKLNKITAASLMPGQKLKGSSGMQRVVSVTLNNDLIDVYDLVEVKKNHRFYANGVLVSNCEFLIYEETLINSLKLVELAGIDPILKQGQVRWYKKPEKGRVYVVSLDPSLGTGGDHAAIQVLELPNMYQVAEWQHNRTTVQQQIRILAEITKFLTESIESNTDVYYSLENNTLGEAALVALAEYGEEKIRGIFLSEPKKPGASRVHRKGFTTTHKTKLSACAKFKNLVETNKITLASKALISELKTFIAAGSSYQAKIGEKDDLVMSMLLAVRMTVFLREFDPNLDEKLKDDGEEFLMPMPFIIV